MEGRNISQSALARMANINQSQLNRAINGYQPFFPRWKKDISIVLGIPEDILFPEETKKED